MLRRSSSMFRLRVQHLTEELDKVGLGGALFMSGPNLRYLLGLNLQSYERLTLCFLNKQGEVAILVPKLDEDRVKAQSPEWMQVISYEDSQDPWPLVKEILSDKAMDEGALGIEGSLPYRVIEGLQRLSNRLSLRNLDGLMQRMRLIKSDDELEAIRRASDILQEAMRRTLSEIKAGIREREVEATFHSIAMELGAESTPFCLVQSGPNSARPHMEPTSRVLEHGDLLVFDAGCTFEGYFADVTRTVCLGTAGPEQNQAFKAVVEAQELAISEVKPGISAGFLDSLARGLLRERGYGEYLLHRTGHGLGLEVHEEPFIKEGSTMVLRSGMVFTIEPGIYLPGRFGVRFEDNIIVTDDSYVNLTLLPKSLAIRDYL